MKKLSDNLICKIEGWLRPLPEQLQASVWKALRESEKAGVFFNTHARDFSELFVWRHTPAGDHFWEFVANTADFFQQQWKEERAHTPKYPSPRRTYMERQSHVVAAA